MACPACGCKTTYQYNDDDFGPDDERTERCAACGHIFDIEDSADEDDDDRADCLNGHEVRMPTFDKLRAHFDALNIGGQHFDSMEQRDSKEMFPDADESGWDAEKRNREIWSEEIAELMKKHFPSQSVDDKQKRADLLEKFFGTRSWTAVENMRAERLEFAFGELKKHLEPPEEKPVEQFEDVPA